MKLQITVEDEFFNRVPGLRVAVTTAELDGGCNAAGVDEHWSEAWRQFRARGLASALDHPHVAAYRAALKAAGIKVGEFPPAIESLTRRALKQPEPFRINAIVDFYNGMCLRHVVPTGAVDAEAAVAAGGDDIRLRQARTGDVFTAPGESAAIAMTPGELAWFCGPVALSRHILWRQSVEGLVSERTRRLIFISEYVDGVSDESAREAADALAEGTQNLLHARTQQVWLRRESPSATLFG